MLADSAGCRDIPALRRHNVKKVGFHADGISRNHPLLGTLVHVPCWFLHIPTSLFAKKNTYFHLLARPITNTWTLLQSRSSIVLRRRCGPKCIPTNLCKACWKPSVILLNPRSGTQAQLFEVMFLLVGTAAHLDINIVVWGIAVGSCAGSSFYGPGIEYLELWQDEAWQQKGRLGTFRTWEICCFFGLIQEDSLSDISKTDSQIIKVTNWCTNFMIHIIHIALFHFIFSDYLCILAIPKDYADYCIMNDFDVTWSFAFGGLTGWGNASFYCG